MQVDARAKLIIRLQRYLFLALFVGVIALGAWLSTRYSFQADWTSGARNSLSEDSRALLVEIHEPVDILAFVRADNELLRNQLRDLVGRYQKHKPDIKLEFINPDAAPDQVRELGITFEGELLIRYQGRSEKLQQHTEQALTNALLRIARQDERWIVFLGGHGERDPAGQANHDLGEFGAELTRKGLNTETLSLTQSPAIPDNTHVLVIASPSTDLLPGEVRIVRNWLEQGGNLLWLREPNEAAGMDALAEYLGIEFLPGVIVDATTQLLGIQNPEFVLVDQYPAHEIARGLDAMTLFPSAAAMQTQAQTDWQAESILATDPRTWTELGQLQGQISFDADSDERAGPLNVGYALERADTPDDPAMENAAMRKQRIAVLGDGDFLSNSFLGNGANLDLGLNLIHWLAHDDALINISAKAAPDQRLELGRTAQGVIGFGFLIVLPLVLIGAGVWIWWRRRKR